MQTFLLWKLQGDEDERRSSIDRVKSRLQGDCSALFGTAPDVVSIQQADHALLYLELPVSGWTAPFFESDGRSWALSLDYPVDADSTFQQDDARHEKLTYLIRFSRALQHRPSPSLRHVSPPYALIFGEHSGDTILVQNDLLGFCQLLEYDAGPIWALTNRPYALKALGIRLTPEPVEWAARALTGWFPTNRTGISNLRAVPPATQLRITSLSVERTSYETLRQIVAPTEITQEGAIEIAAESLLRHVESASRFWSHAGVAFSAGRDSRSVAAAMIAAGVPMDYLRTHGHESNQEMIIARHLARVAGQTHVRQTKRAFPPASASSLERGLALAARWQCGLMETKAHKGFCRASSHLSAGNVNIMGKHGEVGRGYYYRRASRGDPGAANWREGLVDYLSSKDLDLLNPDMREPALDLIRESVAQADDVGLSGHAALDFFYLFERTRRWASGTIYCQPGKVITPFLNPTYISAVFNLPPESKTESAVHEHLIRSHMPIWADIPYLSDGAAKKWCKRHTTWWRKAHWKTADLLAAALHRKRSSYRISKGRRYAFDNHAYWRTVGGELITKALSSSDLVNSMFDRKQLEQRWPNEPDIIAVASVVERVVREPAQ